MILINTHMYKSIIIITIVFIINIIIILLLLLFRTRSLIHNMSTFYFGNNRCIRISSYYNFLNFIFVISYCQFILNIGLSFIITMFLLTNFNINFVFYFTGSIMHNILKFYFSNYPCIHISF